MVKPEFVNASYLDFGRKTIRVSDTCLLAKLQVVAFVTFSIIFFGDVAQSKQTCDTAAWTASVKTGVPFSVLKAISRSETGRNISGTLQPWPWAVNMEGVGKWFNSEDEALSYVRDRYRNGSRNFDIGCFQINFKWHGENFASFRDMFNPELNAIYAAKFLQKHYLEKGNWSAAAGAYHSKTKKYAERYRAIFDKIYEDVSGRKYEEVRLASASEIIPPTSGKDSSEISLKSNNYPLLKEGENSFELGSLVPLDTISSGATSLFASNNNWVEK